MVVSRIGAILAPLYVRAVVLVGEVLGTAVPTFPIYFPIPSMAEVISHTVEELLTSELLVAHLATCADGLPHVALLWYRYEDGIVEIMTTGQKLSNIKENHNVAFSVQKDERGHPKWRVSLTGTATVVEDEETNREQNRKLNRKYNAEVDAWQDENTLVRIEIDFISHEIF